ncbi:MAG TPA: hypothetical protein VGI39_06140 [Polyangiaceae bacterium]
MAKLRIAGKAVRTELLGGSLVALGACVWGCTTVDPGSNFVIPAQTFNANYFFCHVEPEFLTAKKCGPGDPSQGDPSNGCHFNAAAVSGMPLLDHPPVDCGGGDVPVDQTVVGAGSAPQNNLQAASLEMSRDYMTAPIIVRPTGHTHPRTIFTTSDPVVNVIITWAGK